MLSEDDDNIVKGSDLGSDWDIIERRVEPITGTNPTRMDECGDLIKIRIIGNDRGLIPLLGDGWTRINELSFWWDNYSA